MTQPKNREDGAVVGRTREFFNLFGSKGFSLLWAGSLMSQAGDHLNLMALTALIFAVSAGTRTSGLEFSKILLLASAPVLFFGPISGVYADRVSRKTMMIASDLIRAVLVALVPFVAGSMLTVYVLIFLIYTVNRFYLSAKSAALPQIVSGSKLMEANALLSVSAVAALVVGPWGGGILVERYGYTMGFLADAGTYVVSAALVAFITLRSITEIAAERAAELAARKKALGETAKHAFTAHSRAEFAEEAAKLGHEIAAPIEKEAEVIGSTYHRLLGDLKDGLTEMRRSPLVVYSTVSSASAMMLAGFVLIALPVLVRNEFQMGTAGLGQLFSLAGIGMLVGSLVVGRFFARAQRRAIIAISMALAGVTIASMAAAQSLTGLSIGIFLAGLLIAPTNVTCDTILQEMMADTSIGKAFGFRDTVSKAAFGLGGILSGVIVDFIGPRQLFVVVGLAGIAYAAVSPFLYADSSKLNLLNAYPLMRLASGVAARMPRRLSYQLASLLSGAAALLLPTKRSSAESNAARVIGRPKDSPEVRALARRMFRSYGHYYVDFFGLTGGLWRRVREMVRVEGLDHLESALERGKGAIFVTAHLGSWDMGSAALAQQAGLPSMSAIVEPVSDGTSDSAVTSMREVRGINVIPLGKPLRVWRALKRNEIVFIVGERLVGAEGVDVEFFGERATLPRGAAWLSLKSGAPIVPGFCIRQPDGTYVGYIERPIFVESTDDFETAVRACTQRIAHVFEDYIGKYPEQWCMLQPVWGQ